MLRNFGEMDQVAFQRTGVAKIHVRRSLLLLSFVSTYRSSSLSCHFSIFDRPIYPHSGLKIELLIPVDTTSRKKRTLNLSIIKPSSITQNGDHRK